MDPTLLLRYSVEKINLPSGENMFRWLVRQTTVQQYFVYLFWLVKVKFFERDSDPENECFLLRGLSVEYVKIMDLLASHGHGAEYEKDFAYQYLPYILSNAVYFGFFFLCPGSRHIYTRGFKKTILLQVVKVMHGLQLCTASVKVLWVKLFPEDNHDADDDVEDVGEIFPVQIAVGNDSKYTTKNIMRDASDIHTHTQTKAAAGGGEGGGSGVRNRVERGNEDVVVRSGSADTVLVKKTSSINPPFVHYRRVSMPGMPFKWQLGDDEREDGMDKRQRAGRGLASTHTQMNPSRFRLPQNNPKVLAKTQGFNIKRSCVDSSIGVLDPISSDMRHSSDTKTSSLRVSNSPLETGSETGTGRGRGKGPSSLQNLMRGSSSVIDLKKSHSNRFRDSDTVTASSTPTVFGVRRFQAPIGTPDLWTILHLPPNPPALKDSDPVENSSNGIGSNSTGNCSYSPRKGGGGGLRPSSRGDPVSVSVMGAVMGAAGTGIRQTNVKTMGLDPADDISTPSWAYNIRPGTGTRSGTETWTGCGTRSGIGEVPNLHEDEGNPLERTLLKSTSLRHGHKLTKLTRRQTTETINMKSVSPLVQEYFVSSVMAPVRTSIGAQLMHRTVPVSWCATGGADTHRKRVIFTDLHQEITDKGKEVDKEFLIASYLGKKNIVKNLKLINSSCAAVLKSDAATIGRFSLDLVRRQQQQRKSKGAGGRGDFIPELPIEAPSADLLSLGEAILAANFDPADLDDFLANI